MRPRLFLPAALLPRGTNALVAETVLTRGFGRRSEMAEEVLPSAKWLYCGEPNESQRAVLGKDCGAGAVPHNSHFRLGAVTVLPPPRRTLFPAGPKSPPHPHPAASPRPAASVYHYLGLGHGSSVIPPSFCHHLTPDEDVSVTLSLGLSSILSSPHSPGLRLAAFFSLHGTGISALSRSG